MAGLAAAPLLGGAFTLGEAFSALSIGGTVLSAVSGASSARAQGNAANAAAQYQARQMEQQAGQERASAQRKSIEERRRAQLASSRALALSAASGAGASDPTVIDIMGDLAGEGEYRALSAMYEGEEKARGSQMGATAKRYEGASAVAESRAKARNAILGGGMSLLQRYG